jgi:sec-independent protein translocase protein TatA
MMSSTELIIILAIVVLLFGAKKIPELAKGIGSGIRNFKDEMKKVENDTLKESEKVTEVKAKQTEVKQEA